MKFITIRLLLFLALPAASSLAQGRFMYGLNGGINFWNLDRHDLGDGSNSSTNRIVYPIGGIEFGYFDWDHFSYSAQFIFDQSSIEIPLLFNVPITHGEWKAYLFAGPAISAITGEYRNVLYSFESNYGIYGGVGISHALSKTNDLFLQASYDYGLKNVASTPMIDFPGTHYFKEYTRILRIYFGILFGSEDHHIR
jgi:hypothetical protein